MHTSKRYSENPFPYEKDDLDKFIDEQSEKSPEFARILEEKLKEKNKGHYC